jgi:hypothetical protein
MDILNIISKNIFILEYGIPYTIFIVLLYEIKVKNPSFFEKKFKIFLIFLRILIIKTYS